MSPTKTSTSQTKRSRSLKCSTWQSGTEATPSSSSFSIRERSSAKASGSIQYHCVFCDQQLSSKGVCKRHLDEQHVSRKVYKCEKCPEWFFFKSEAKKHCNLCGKGVLSYTHGKEERKKVYACEFTGDYFSSLPKYLEHLLKLCETSDTCSAPSRRRKLFALLNQPGLAQHVAEISTREYGSREVWKKSQWSDASLSKAIEQLEHATIHDNGTIEFGKSSDSQHLIQNTYLYLNSLLCAGNLPSVSTAQPTVSVVERTTSPSMQSPLPRQPAGSDSGTATPTPSRPLSRTITSQSGMTQISGVTLANSVSSCMDVSVPLNLDTKGKRHLSDHSRFYVPPRYGEGPPAVPRLPVDLDTLAQCSQPYAPSTTSSTSLPLRIQEEPCLPQQPSVTSIPSIHDYPSSTAGSTLNSDAASGSTLMSSFQEPELLDPMPFNGAYWANQQSIDNNYLGLNNNMNYGYPGPLYYYPNDISLRTSSVATDHTCVGDCNEHEQKLSDYSSVPSYSMLQNGTFLLDDDDPI